MKTKNLFVLTITAFAMIAVFFSCEVGLGDTLDINGPLVEITAPAPRKAVPAAFALEGTVSDSSGIKRVEITAQLDRKEISKRWRYTGGSWEFSEDSGANWQTLAGAEWNGDEKSASWLVPIDMNIASGNGPEPGEYIFLVQAWDSAGFSDDNSFKTIVLIYDNDLPKVEIVRPNLFSRYADYKGGTFTTISSDPEVINDVAEFNTIHGWLNTDTYWQTPEMLGKFVTQGFLFQWQIEDNHDLWSIELLFYDVNVDIDEIEETPRPENYYYRYWQNVGPPPDEPSPQDYPKPNGSINIPALDVSGNLGTGANYEFKEIIAEKKTIRVVALCYDAAGHVNQEKTLGYFIYWPDAGKPWISYTTGMDKPEDYNVISRTPTSDDPRKAYLDPDPLMIYPGRSIKATALQANGVTHVEYSLYDYKINDDGSYTIDSSPINLEYLESMRTIGKDFDYTDNTKTRIKINNEPRNNGTYSTIFSWELVPLPQTGYYVVKAQAFSGGTESELFIESEEYTALFMVQDISFPIFGEPSPAASDPLFRHIANNTITISGEVTDATNIVSLTMVWINPESRNFSAMSQLQYFRDSSYAGWMQAKELKKGDTDTEPTTKVGDYPYDPSNPNRLWNLNLTPDALPNEDGRQVFRYSIEIDLEQHMNISAENPMLRSQMFLLRAENPDGRCTIITYAPQGDMLPPTIKINEVSVIQGGTTTKCIPGEYQQVPKFSDNTTNKIIVIGEWTEDSTEFLDVQTYLYPNMEFKINGINVTDTADVTRTPANGIGTTSGTFTIEAIVDASNMKDTLVVDTSIRDIGGNPSEHSASWLIESDNLRFLRISSLEEDTAYKAGDEIEIFLEFNKPVRLKTGRSGNPILTLNTTGGADGIATYKSQTNESTRQFFTYKVEAGQNTPNNVYLNVTGLSNTNWEDNAYPFTWISTGLDNNTEEIRLTMTTGHNGDKPSGRDFYARALPVTNEPSNGDYPFTLMGGKRITVDNQAPTITGFTASPQGWHKAGVNIYIIATFSEQVRIGDTTPWLILGTGNSGETEKALAEDIQVNNDKITFRYIVKTGDTTGENALTVTSFGGQILDIPGTAMTTLPNNTTLSGVYLDTTAPARPKVAIGTTSGGGDIAPESNATSDRPLGNQYYDNVHVTITGDTGSQNLGKIEYSFNGGQDWTSSTTSPINISLPTNGSYSVQARQIDQAGNESGSTGKTSFTWDKGSLVTSINSTTPNGQYTWNTSRNEDNVSIQVNFRKALTFTGNQTITLNVANGASISKTVTLSAANLPTMPTNQLTFTYNVASGDNTADLDVTDLDLNATDGGDVPAPFINTLPAAGQNPSLRLGELKNIEIVTGNLAVTSTNLSTGSNTVNTDNSINATLTVTFNHSNLARGTTTLPLTITQSAANYRIPTVLTETQRNKYRSIENFDTYYTRGTNGYVDGTGSDTSTKYILDYTKIPADITPSASGDDDEKFAEAFRQAEKITINANASVITLSGSTLIINLSGTYALQVPGAQYDIVIPAGFVQDSLSNSSPAVSVTPNAVGGIAKPFIRVRRAQETIRIETVSNNRQARIRADQPLTTNARLDCRTPGTIIYYITGEARTEGTDNVTAQNWNATVNPPADTNTPAAPTQPGDPRITTTNRQQFTATTTPITIGGYLTNGTTATTITNVQGLQWRIRAKATTSTATPPADTATLWSEDSEEMAFRSVLTYQINNLGTQLGQNLGTGDQIWIRGGDAIGSSNIPGFPLTWEDDWGALTTEGRRAGIRLLELESVTTGLNTTSVWRWVTWEINAPAYFDFIMGHDEESDAVVAAQYGPRRYAYQRAGWTSYKVYYRMNPGKHRWMYVNAATGGAPGNNQDKGSISFALPFMVRPEYTTATYP